MNKRRHKRLLFYPVRLYTARMQSGQDDITRRFEGVRNSTTFNRIVRQLGLGKKKVLDLGCGYGEYMALCGPGSLGVTTTLAEVEYGAKHGTRIVRSNVEELDKIPELQTEQFEAVWSNNLFEHLLAPHRFLNSLKRYATGDTLLVLGVPVVPFIPGLMRLKKFRGALSVAHINFFTKDTLKLTAERAGWSVVEARPFIFSNKVLDSLVSVIAPHIYLVAKNDPTFTYPDKKLKEWKDEPHYQYVLETTGQG